MLIWAFSRWTPWNRLLPVDIQGAGGVRDLIEDRDLKEAYSEAIEQYGNSDLTFWKDRLYAKKLQDDCTSEKVRVKKETENLTLETPSIRDGIHVSSSD